MNPVTVRLIPAAPAVALSEPLRMTLEVEGPRGLEVAMPTFPVPPAGSGGWRVQAAGPAERREAGDATDWRLPLRAEPGRAGESLPVELPPVRYRFGDVWEEAAVPSIAVTVTTAVPDATATPRPLAGWVEAESVASDGPAGSFWVVALVLALSAVVALLLRLSRPVSPEVRYRRELAALAVRLDRGDDPRSVAQTLGRVMRRRLGPPAEARTPAEVGGAAGEWLARIEILAFGTGPADAEAVRELIRVSAPSPTIPAPVPPAPPP